MRLVSVFGLMLTLVAMMLFKRCEGGSLHRHPMIPDEDDDVRAFGRHFRDYGLIRPRAVRADDAFDDYGHLRFGRSDD